MTAKPQGPPGRNEIESLLAFWFDGDANDAASMQRQMRRWFESTPDEDREMAERFGALAVAAAAGACEGLAREPRGRLGLILLLDQLPRNLHRGRAEAFISDARALELCVSGMRLGLHVALTPLERIFFSMPLQHAESREIQKLSVETFAALATLPAPPPLAAALRDCAHYAVAHRDIVERFGRFPYRNRALGRTSTEAEIEFLASWGPGFGQ
jgi:uncharacterized protein (DUF924 family)